MTARTGHNPKIVTAYVVFQDRADRRWWDIITHPGWRHCWVAMPAPWPAPGLLASYFTMKVEPLAWGIDVEVFFAPPLEVAQAFVAAGATAVVEITVRTPPVNHRQWIPRGLFSCVTIVKAVLGLRAWNVWTPRALCDYLLAHRGARLLGRADAGQGDT